MQNLFSHAAQPEQEPARESERRTHAVYAELNLPFEEIWQGFTAYTHLWWPRELRVETGSYIEITPELLLDQTEEGENTVLGETVHYLAGDLIALRFSEDTAVHLHSAFPGGLSFTFDIGSESEPTMLEVSSGIIAPRQVDEDAELGLAGQGAATLAQELLTGFTRFMGNPQAVTLEEL